MTQFKSIENRGFHMTFENGWTVSVQWGPGNYCEKRSSEATLPWSNECRETGWDSKTAEVAAWNKAETWYDFENDQVKGHCSTDEVLEFMNIIANIKE